MLEIKLNTSLRQHFYLTNCIDFGNVSLLGALFALKQKKMYSKQVTNLENQLLALEQQKVALEGASISATVVNTMSTGAKAMSDIHKGMYVRQLRLDVHIIDTDLK